MRKNRIAAAAISLLVAASVTVPVYAENENLNENTDAGSVTETDQYTEVVKDCMQFHVYADVTGDGKVELDDLATIRQFISKKIASLDNV